MEESALVAWCKQMEAWGWPARISQLRKMAVELLEAKGDTEPLGINWHHAFLDRHSELKSRFATPQDKDRFLAQDYGIISHWFDL